MSEENKNVLFLFDVDGTLSKSRCKAPAKILEMLRKLRATKSKDTCVKVAFVGGSDLAKQVEQLGVNLLEMFDYAFPENGVQYYKGSNLVSSESVIKFLGEEQFKNLINHFLGMMAKVECPKKRGTFIETRNSMINICPVGRTCSTEERAEFFEFDKKNKIRETIVAESKNFLASMKMTASIGGQISIDVFPQGWDKTYCLNHIKESKIYFFGDMTHEGGNDYEIYSHPKTNGVKVNGPDDTIVKVNEALKAEGMPEIKYD